MQPDAYVAPAWLARLECGHEARLRAEPRAGGWITCTDGRCQGQRRITAVRPAPAGWVVPARYPLTVLHRPAGDGEQTVCALPMDEHELWVPVERRDGDAVCRVCEAEGAESAAEDVAGVLF